MRSDDRFVVPGRPLATVERDVLAQRGEPSADWSSYELPGVSTGGESVPLPITVRLTEQGDDVVVDAEYHWRGQRAQIWFEVNELDARRLLRAALGAPPEPVDPQHTDEVVAGTVSRLTRVLKRYRIAGLVCSGAALVLTFVSLQLPNDHTRAAPSYLVAAETAENQLAFVYGVQGALCNGHHTITIHRTGQEITCAAGGATYHLRVTSLDPVVFEVAGVD